MSIATYVRLEQCVGWNPFEFEINFQKHLHNWIYLHLFHSKTKTKTVSIDLNCVLMEFGIPAPLIKLICFMISLRCDNMIDEQPKCVCQIVVFSIIWNGRKKRPNNSIHKIRFDDFTDTSFLCQISWWMKSIKIEILRWRFEKKKKTAKSLLSMRLYS